MLLGCPRADAEDVVQATLVRCLVHWPRVSRADCVRAQSRSFLSRVFGGATGEALLHFVEEHDLSPADIEQLKKVLARKGR